MYAGYFVDVAFLQSGGMQNIKIRRDMEQEVNACVPGDCTSKLKQTKTRVAFVETPTVENVHQATNQL